MYLQTVLNLSKWLDVQFSHIETATKVQMFDASRAHQILQSTKRNLNVVHFAGANFKQQIKKLGKLMVPHICFLNDYAISWPTTEAPSSGHKRNIRPNMIRQKGQIMRDVKFRCRKCQWVSHHSLP